MSEREYKIIENYLIGEDNEFKDFDRYQIAARTTANTDKNKDERIVNWALGVAGEAGEIADMIKKAAYHGHVLDDVELVKEIGDVLWYLANLSTEVGVWFGAIAEKNIDKLRARYPEGFSEERSINRND